MTADSARFDSSRREFLHAAFAAGSLAVLPALKAEDVKSASQLVAGKDPRLLVLKPFPAVFETPTPLLLGHQLTPANLLFVRNNSQPESAATLKPAAAADRKVQIAGQGITVKELRDMPQTSYEMVLQCSGNSRSLYAQTVKSGGTQWGRGGMGNVKFSGVKLAAVLEKQGAKIDPRARYVTVSGNDDPLQGKEDFEHSLPLDDVLNHSILALDLNGKPLPAIHGGPVRLITPGVYGTMQMKWLTSLKFDRQETSNYNQIPRYRVPNRPIKPGEKITYTFANSHHNWRMKVKSVVLSPTPGQQLQAGKVRVEGVAFNDGAAKIDSVLVSINQGQSWRRTRLKHSDSPFGWTRFAATVKLPAGKQSVWTKAVDALGRSQPLDGSVHWNPSGYEWNGVEKIDVLVK